MNSPFFSIIIPVYNGLSHGLPICLKSIWQQPLSPSLYEVICVDDCSTDDTREWLDEEATKHSNLRIIKHTVNKRQGGGRNTGIRGAQKWFSTYFTKYLNILCHLSLDTLPFMLTYFFEGVLW